MATAAASPLFPRSLTLLVAAAILLNYVDRGTVGVAAPLMKEELGLSATSFGVAVSAFFWIYVPIQLLVGWLCDRFCVYRLYAGGMAVCAFATALTGLTNGLTSLILLRLLLGIGESIAFPGAAKMIARHVPASRRGIATAFVAAGQALGPTVGTLIGGAIMAAYGWREMFVFFGLVSLVWLDPWRRASAPLLQYSIVIREPRFAVSKVLQHRALWAMSVGGFVGNYVFYFLLTWLPLYLVKSRGYSIADMTLTAGLVYVTQAASALLVGWSSDRLVASGRREGELRRLLLATGSASTAAAIIGIASSSTHGGLVMWLVVVGIILGFKNGNQNAVAQIFAGPRAAGTFVGIANAIGNVAGIVGPIVTGIIIDRTGSYTSAFSITAGVALFGAVWWYVAVPRIECIEYD